ncbi:MAG: OmpA family protein [Cytophagales bacterium]|nr:OmpA family protein [Cytophagales bacterium]
MKAIIKPFLITLFVIISSALFAQKKLIKEAKDHELDDPELVLKVRKADTRMSQNSYYDAIDVYREVLVDVPDNAYVNHRLAFAYYISRDYANASKYYAIAVALDDHHYPEDYYYYAESLQMQGKYVEALKEFQLFAKQKSKDPQIKLLKKYVRQEKRSCNYALRIIDEDTAFAHVDLMPKGINHAYSDFSPMPVGHDTLIFAARMEDSIISYERGEKEFHPVRLYQVTRQSENNWNEPTVLEINDKLDHKYEHTANGTYNPEGNRFYYTRCIEDGHHKIVCSIYYTEKDENGEWGKPKKLPEANKRGYTSTQPTVQSYTKKKRKKVQKFDVVYFSSDRPKSVGGLDIWFVTVDNEGNVSEATNCGKRINTIRNEVTPYYDNVHSTLFFSSNYHYGLGGYDVQKATGQQKRWAKPQNAGIPVNSSYDDTYYRLEKDTTTDKAIGYIVSNRPGGFALKSATCCDDIYHFDYYDPETWDLAGLVTEKVKDDTTGNKKVLKDVQVGLVRTHHIDKAIVDSTVDFNILAEHIKWRDTTLQDGKYDLEVVKERSYHLVVQKEGYETPKIFDLDSLLKINRNTLDVELVKIIDSTGIAPPKDTNATQAFNSNLSDTQIQENQKFVLKNVYFDYAKSTLKDESTPALRLLLTFMLKHPNVKIEVSGHTDSNGSDDLNKKLSDDRAKAVRKYLTDNGVEPNMVVAVGYGEDQPIAPNQKPDGSDNPEGRKRNRRTEVKILSKTDFEVETEEE